MQMIAPQEFTHTHLVKDVLEKECPFLTAGTIRHIVYGEDVNPDTDMIALYFIFYQIRPAVNDLRKGEIIVLRTTPVLQLKIRRVLIALQEPFIVGPGHTDVDVVIPGDIALVTYGTQHRAKRQGILYLMAGAELMQVVENTHLNLPQLLDVRNLSHRLF